MSWQKGDKILIERTIKGQIYSEVLEVEAERNGMILAFSVVNNEKIYGEFDSRYIKKNFTQQQREIKDRWGILDNGETVHDSRIDVSYGSK